MPASPAAGDAAAGRRGDNAACPGLTRVPPRPVFGADVFRAALAMFATGVTIVTARDATARRSA